MSKFKIQSSKLIATTGAIVALLISASPAFAHVMVKPNTVGVALFQTFTMEVPNEKGVPTIAVKLMIPQGISSVSPNVKPGWVINVLKNGTADDAQVVEIDWTGGSIPAGQRDGFVFSAQVPSSETSLVWKAYQTYKGGAVVSWDQDPSSMNSMTDDEKQTVEDQRKGPFSTTKVVNDLVSPMTNSAVNVPVAKSGSMAMTFSIVALALSATAIGMQLRKKSK